MATFAPLSRPSVAVVGKAPSSRGAAPYHDDEWEIWTLSDLVPSGQAARFDRHFEFHPLDWFKVDGQPSDYYKWMAGIRDKPVYLQELADDIPAGQLFPKDEIVRSFGTYFTNSVSWMIAAAIYLRPKRLGVWGVDMAQNSEYEKQRPSCEYFMGLAAGMGIEVVVPDTSDLLKCRRLYGFEDVTNDMWKKCQARRQELATRIQVQESKAQEHLHNSIYLKGALEGMDWTEQWT